MQIYAKSRIKHVLSDKKYAYKLPKSYLTIIHALGTIRMGMTRDELVKEGGITSNGKLTRTLEDLTECGFIKRIPSYGGKAKDDLIQLVDNFTIFYYKYMKENLNNDEHFWSNSYNSPIRAAWTGLAFERVCFQHIPQIKQAMGIAGVATQCYPWKAKGDALSSGTQIDMVLDRRDNIINICEMKFSKGEYTITKDYAMSLNNKVERFIESTKNKKTILLTMITTNGVVHNEYWNQIQCDITADKLFNA